MKLQLALIALNCVIGSFAFTLKSSSPREACPPKPETVKELLVSNYTGEWYQVAGIPLASQPSGSRCIRANYGLREDGTVSVRNSIVYPEGGYGEICGYADIPNPEFPGELEVHFPSSPPGDYWLLDTDYNNYASVYTCRDIIGLVKFEFAWLLTREKNPAPEVVNKALDAFIRNGLSVENFEAIDQGPDCIYDNPEGPNCESTQH